MKEDVREHWKEHRPRMYRALKKSGGLEKSLDLAVDLTSEAFAEAVQAGADPNQAWEALREEWAYLPAENQVRELEPSRVPLGLRLAPELPEKAALPTQFTPTPASSARTSGSRTISGLELGLPRRSTGTT